MVVLKANKPLSLSTTSHLGVSGLIEANNNVLPYSAEITSTNFKVSNFEKAGWK